MKISKLIDAMVGFAATVYAGIGVLIVLQFMLVIIAVSCEAYNEMTRGVDIVNGEPACNKYNIMEFRNCITEKFPPNSVVTEVDAYLRILGFRDAKRDGRKLYYVWPKPVSGHSLVVLVQRDETLMRVQSLTVP